MRFLPAIFANIILAASALGFGSLLRPLFPEKFSEIDRFALTLLGGLGLLGTILFCVGQFWFSRSAIVLVLLAGVLLSVGKLPGALRKRRTVLAMGSPPIIPLAVISSVLIVTAIGGFAEPIGDMNSDAIAYHYHGPKVWLREAVIRPVPDEVLTSFPSVVETQFAALMSLGGPRAPGFIFARQPCFAATDSGEPVDAVGTRRAGRLVGDGIVRHHAGVVPRSVWRIY